MDDDARAAVSGAQGPSSRIAGTIYSLGAYAIWGLFPLYFRAVATIPAMEVLAHRIAWSAVFLALILSLRRRWRTIAAAFADRRLVGLLVISSLLIAINWGVFIWAVEHHRVLESSLGYFVSPLVSVALAVVVLGERLSPRQWLALVLAAAAVAFELILLGALPWVALALATSFAAYGLVRKITQVEPVSGLFIEAALLAPLAVLYLGVIEAAGSGFSGRPDPALNLLLLLAGPVTALPLILFVAGARRIRLSTLGLLQYITPTGQLLLAVFAFDEPFPPTRLVVFLCIWSGLALYTAEGVLGRWQR